MTQIELKQGNKTMVGFINPKLAVFGNELKIGKSTWIVSAVYGYEPKERVAWWFRAERISK